MWLQQQDFTELNNVLENCDLASWKLWITQPCKLCQIHRPILQNFALKLNYIFVEDSWSAFRINSKSVYRDESNTTRNWSLQWDIVEVGNPSWHKGNSGVMHFGHTGLFTYQNTDWSQEVEEIHGTYGRFPLTKHKPYHPKHTCTSCGSLTFPFQRRGKHIECGGTMGAVCFHKLSVILRVAAICSSTCVHY